MKKISFLKEAACALLSVSALLLFPSSVKADTSVESMDIDVSIESDGSARITQYWTNAYADDGTEYYLYYKDSGYLEFSDLTVSDSVQEYENIGDWDVDADFYDKAYCCGINPVEDGVELCWGISEYGDNDYTISYTIGNLVRAYDDEDGLFYRFVNSGMAFFPTDCTLTIHMADGTPLTGDNASIWAFGFDGTIVFEDGSIFASTDSPLYDDENMTILTALDPSLLNASCVQDGAFSDVIDIALEDSDYIDQEFSSDDYDDGYDDYGDSWDDDDYWDDDSWDDDSWDDDSFYVDSWDEPWYAGFCDDPFFIMTAGIFIAIFVVFILIFLQQKKKDDAFIDFAFGCPPYTKIPNDGQLSVSYLLAKNAKKCAEGDIIGAYIMKMMISGAVIAVPNKNHPDKQDLILHPDAVGSDYREQELMDMLLDASDGEYRLTQKRLNRYAENHYERFDSFFSACEANSQLWLRSHGYLKGQAFHELSDLNDEGLVQLAQVIGLYRFMSEGDAGSSDSQAEGYANNDGESAGNNTLPQDDEFWTELLPYAVLFNLVDEFEFYYKKTWGEAYYHDHMYYYFWYSHHSCSCGYAIRTRVSDAHSAHSAGTASAFMGGGGGASMGGGGGFSGGGGGGTR